MIAIEGWSTHFDFMSRMHSWRLKSYEFMSFVSSRAAHPDSVFWLRQISSWGFNDLEAAIA
jgi:hypothetical protein